jgi:hypothetical protein
MLALSHGLDEHVFGPHAEARVLIGRDGPAGSFGTETLSVSGWPESARSMSGSGPFGPGFHGV